MKRPSRRPEQVAGTIRQVLTDALARDVRDPRVGFVTVTNVLVTNDLSHARVMVSVPGDDAHEGPARCEGLQSAAGFLRARAAKALTTRTVPELHFELDQGLAHAARIKQLLASIRREDAGLIGALLVDKPAGITSHDVVQRVRRALGTRAVGHTGTLDPFATGLLVVLVGRATRLARFVESEAKTYLATARLGVRTDTDDLTGSVVEERPADRAEPGTGGRGALAVFAGRAAAAAPRLLGQAYRRRAESPPRAAGRSGGARGGERSRFTGSTRSSGTRRY